MKALLQKNGFIHYQSDIEYSNEDYQTLINEISFLEKDPYAPSNVIRNRRYANAIILPWEGNQLFWLPTVKQNNQELSGYDQGSNNPEHQNIRYFNSISQKLKETELLKSLILEDFCLTYGLSEHYLPIYVGVHLVTVSCANNDLPGFSSPDCFHQDGEPFTFAHLVQRNGNASGGNNYIGKIKCRNKKLTEISKEDIIDSFVLKKFLESFAVYDNAVSHYVDHLIKIDPTGEPAQRTMILIDFSLTKQNI